MAADTSAPPEPTLPPECQIDYGQFVTQDDEPLDGYQERQMDLLRETLRVSWQGPGEGRPWTSGSNVGVFHAINAPAIVPDCFVAVDVEFASDTGPKENQSYFVWQHGKPPDVVVEIVSKAPGCEDTEKLKIYERIGVTWYVIFDRDQFLSNEQLRVYESTRGKLKRSQERLFSEMNLGIAIWHGEFDGITGDWLRWTDGAGNLLANGVECQEELEKQVAAEHERAELERLRAEQVTRQRDALLEIIRKAGLDPNQP